MLVRYRWYKVKTYDTKIRWDDLSSMKIDNNNSYGFLAAQTTSDGKKFRFFWRTSVSITKLDSEGTPVSESVASFDYQDFFIKEIGKFILMRVENPGRSLRELFNALEDFGKNSISTKLVTFENFNPSSIFEGVDVYKLTGIQINGATLASNLFADLSIKSKSQIDLSLIPFLKENTYTKENSTFELIKQGISGDVMISKNGTIKVSSEIANYVAHMIEKDIIKNV